MRVPTCSKPPLGIKTRRIHQEERLEELRGAIIRYAEQFVVIPVEWTEEWNELTMKLSGDPKWKELANKPAYEANGE